MHSSDGDSGPKSAGKKRVVSPGPVEADSEKGEKEWIVFGCSSEESCEEEEEELLRGLSSDDESGSRAPSISDPDQRRGRQPARIGFTIIFVRFRGLMVL